MSTSAIAILVAAGSGRRMGFDKLAAEIAGKSVLERSVEAFQAASLVEGIFVVTSEANDVQVREWIDKRRFPKLRGTVAGGAERVDSVAAGVAAVPEEFSGVVAVHDAARPLILPEVIDEVISAAREFGAASVARPVSDTLKRVDEEGMVVDSVDREGVWAMETPQCARVAWMREALAHVASADSKSITDEVSALQAVGKAVRMVHSRAPNLKITYPGDVELAARMLVSGGGNA